MRIRVKNKYRFIYAVPSHYNSHNPKLVYKFRLWFSNEKKSKLIYGNLILEKVVKFRNEYLKNNYPKRWEKVKQEEGIDETNNADNFHKHSSWVCGS